MIISAKNMHHKSFRKHSFRGAVAVMLDMVKLNEWTVIESAEDATGRQKGFDSVRSVMANIQGDREFITRIEGEKLKIMRMS